MKKWMLLACLLLVGCGEVVPPGKTVIILPPSGESTIFDKGVYHAWGRDKEYYVDEKLKSFNEDDMTILCADDVSVTVDIKTVCSFDVTPESLEFIKNKVPAAPNETGHQELSLDQFYAMAVKDIVRNTARSIISKETTDDIRPKQEQLEANIQTTVLERVKTLGYPLNVSAVRVNDIQYSQIQRDQREAIKKAQLEDQRSSALAEAQLAQAKREVAIEQERAKVLLVKAQAQADENKVLSESLTPEFLQWRQLEVLQDAATKLSSGSANTIFLMPFQMMNSDTLNSALVRDAVQKN